MTTTTTTPATTSASTSHNTSNHVYIQSKQYAWVPARLLEMDTDKQQATVSVSVYNEGDEQSILTDRGSSGSTSGRKHKTTLEKIDLTKYPNSTLPLQNVDTENTGGKLRVVQDMVDLPYLHEAAILYNLKWRHLHGLPYTRTGGNIIVAVNPYHWYLDLYKEDIRIQYAQNLVWNTTGQSSNTVLEPHVYEISSMAYRGLAVEQENQSILVSGESGAGKTETVKILLRDLASIQNGPHLYDGANSAEEESPIVKKVLDSNPLLEAFGNAQTIRNDNSSRFGKYILLQFDCEDLTTAAYAGKNLPSCHLAGSTCEVYLLEKSRVVSHEPYCERTYHIFYQLLAAPEHIKVDIWIGLAGTDQESFRYVGYSETNTIEGMTDAQRWDCTIASLALIGIIDDELKTLMRSLCIVLQLGNLLFVDGTDDNNNNDKDVNVNNANVASSVVSNTNELEELAELMGVDCQILQSSLTIRTMTARNEVFQVPLSSVQAKDSCDAFAKEIYAKSFLWLVRKINYATCAEKNYDGGKKSGFGTIGLLDIFGFESFVVNRFEQLCINYANEKLQQKFTQDIFRSVQTEYEYEGIELEEITYDDNTDVLDLVEGRMGLIAFLNEECVRPGGSDKGFVAKAAAMNKDNISCCFIRENSFDEYQFGIQHYAGLVVYDAQGFVTKNMDTLPTDLQDCAKQSTNSILSKEFTNDSMMNVVETSSTPNKRRPIPATTAAALSSPGKRSRGSNLVGSTVWTKFRNQLTTLMTNLKQTRSRYIRCIKPNTLKKPKIMQHVSTVEQLRCAGVVAAVTISRSAFPNRLEHDVVLDRFRAMWRKGQHHAAEAAVTGDDESNRSKQLVDRMLSLALEHMESKNKDGKLVKAFVMGNTRVYFRTGALEYLENERVRCLSRWAVDIQSVGRQYIVRTRYRRLRSIAIYLESVARMAAAQRKYNKLRSACVVSECWYRCLMAKRMLVRLRSNYKATLVQSHWRMAVARTSFQTQRQSAVVLQALVRGALQRPKYRVALVEKQEEAKLENQVLALQRKLEEAERKRIEAEKRAEEKVRHHQQQHHAPQHPQEPQIPQHPVASDDAAAVTASAVPTPAVGIVTSSSEEKKEADSVTSSLSNPDDRDAAPVSAQQQQALMDESGKMLEYLRKEVFKLRNHNTQMRRDFDLLKDNNQRLMDANASAGASFAALNQHAKQLSRANDKLATDAQTYKQQMHKLSITQVELREELKMKQATYIAEVHSRLQYQRALSKIIDVAQERCRDDRLVEEFLRIADGCDAEYINGGPTGGGSSSPSPHRTGAGARNSGLMSGFRNLFS